MSLEEILQSIKDGLTQEKEKDQSYLKEQMEIYKDHEYKEEIIRECARLLYDVLDDQQKEKFILGMDQDVEQFKSALKEVHYFIEKKDLEKAKEIILPIIKSLKEENLFKNDSKNIYFSFDEPFEDILFEYLEKPKEQVQRTALPYSDAYYSYALLCYESNEIEKAQDALKKAIQWNPTSSKSNLLYMQTIKKDLKRFFEFTKFSFQYIFRVNDLAQVYRNLAWYFDQSDLKRIAYGCYGISLQYEESAEAIDYMNDLNQKAWFKEPSMGEMMDFGKEYGFSIGPNQDVVGLAFGYGQQCYKEGLIQEAKYFLDIAYALTNSQEVLDLLEKLES